MAESQCHILRLPFEIIVQVFKFLEDIDDVLQFARCCKLVNSVFEWPSIRVAVFRTIIVRPICITVGALADEYIRSLGQFSST
jgi:hypothetical protein